MLRFVLLAAALVAAIGAQAVGVSVPEPRPHQVAIVLCLAGHVVNFVQTGTPPGAASTVHCVGGG